MREKYVEQALVKAVRNAGGLALKFVSPGLDGVPDRILLFGYAKNANNTGYIGFEICEDGLTDASYFNAVYMEAVELCVYLCKQYGLTEKNIICHSEGYKLGIASNHGDVMHWFPKHGKSMDTFRADVKAGLASAAPAEPTTPKKYYRVQVGAYSVKANAEAMLAKIKAAGFTDAFVKYSE
jgi:hypothetical protein